MQFNGKKSDSLVILWTNFICHLQKPISTLGKFSIFSFFYMPILIGLKMIFHFEDPENPGRIWVLEIYFIYLKP